MAKNDKLLIDGIVDERIELSLPSTKRDEVFEYFSFEQILKDYDLSKEEIYHGYTDGRNDGGIDGFYIFVNGHLLTEIDKFPWPKTGSILEVYLITCKHHDTFKQSTLDSLIASITELLDFAIENFNLKGDYSEQLLQQRDNLKNAYKKVSSRLTTFNFYVNYSSRGNSEELGESVVSRGRQIEHIIIESFGNCNAYFAFCGATELIELYRKSPNFTLELPFTDDLSSGETYIVLTKLKDYYEFITDESKLRRYLFDSNVRDYMGLNRVNEDIKTTLLNNNSPDFWWLNNGVTIVATGANIVGKSIQIQDIQIVNGLQTSETIYRYFKEGGIDVNSRSVLIKIIVTKDGEFRDEIIRATNNQTNVELSSLHATDKIQRDIEDVLKLNEFYYERRTNLYKNQGIKPERILTPLYLASGFLSLILKAPEEASFLRARFMKNEQSYDKIFSNETNLLIWHKIAFILKETDRFLETRRPGSNSSSENFLKTRRHFLSFITISIMLKNFNFSISDLLKLDASDYNRSELEKGWAIVVELIPLSQGKRKIKRSLFLDVCEQIYTEEGVLGIERLNNSWGLNNEKGYTKRVKAREKNQEKIDEFNLFVEKVDSVLPKQPWKPETHKKIAEALDCSENEIIQAVNALIKQGRRFKQKDGILYDKSGLKVGFDTERVDPNTFKLIN